jgi:hypothetical protein
MKASSRAAAEYVQPLEIPEIQFLKNKCMHVLSFKV